MTVAENIDALLVRFDINAQTLAKVLDVNPATVHKWRHGSIPREDQIAKMCDYFLIERDDIISDAAGLAAKEHGDVVRRRAARGVGTATVPVLGRVHAGPAGDPDVYDESEDTADIPECYLDIDPDCYVLDYEGDCMSRDFGDTSSLVVSPNSPFGNDSIVVAVIDGTDYVVRRMEHTARELRLKPNSWNPAYEPIVIPRDSGREVELKGRVLGCFKRFD